MLEKALNTNSEYPPIDKEVSAISILEKEIADLEKEINDIRIGAFATKIKRNSTELFIASCPTSGVDIVDLQTKIALLDAKKENLKSELLKQNK